MVPERVVEPSVEEGVVAVGGHRNDVASEEGGVVEAPAVDGSRVHVPNEVDGVEGQPASTEDDYHGDAQTVQLAPALAFSFFLGGATTRRRRAGTRREPLRQPRHDHSKVDESIIKLFLSFLSTVSRMEMPPEADRPPN